MGSGKGRLESLKKLLSYGALQTQDDLREKLESLGYKVTQSTVSRDLRKIGAVKSTGTKGQTIYRLEENSSRPSEPTSFADLILEIRSNGLLVVIQTTPGSASLVARYLDQVKPTGILGTIAGDDTIFVAIAAGLNEGQVIEVIRASFRNRS